MVVESAMRDLATLHQVRSTQARMHNPRLLTLTLPLAQAISRSTKCGVVESAHTRELATLHQMLSTQARMHT